jgi:RNA polymerase sigma-70 factor (ECF subfamily)
MLFRAAPNKPDFEREVMPHMRLLYGVALRMTKADGDAEDLVQEAVLRAYRFWDSYEAGTNCRAWLLRILTNTFRNRYREREREAEILGEVEACETNLAQFQGDGPHDAETALFGHMLSRDVEKALDALPPEFRLPVVLADLEDLSYKEIAEVVGCPAGTVMSRLYRGRRMLQKLLYEYAIESGIIKVNPPATGSSEPNSAPASQRPASNPAEVVDFEMFRKQRKGGGR